MNITFEPGYYERHLKLDGEIIYTFNDFVDDLAEYDEITEEVACDEADLLMYLVRKTYEEKEFTKDFLEHFDKMSEKDFEELFVKATEVIADEIYRRFR